MFSGVARLPVRADGRGVVFAMLASYVLRGRWCRRWRVPAEGHEPQAGTRPRNVSSLSSALSTGSCACARRTWRARGLRRPPRRLVRVGVPAGLRASSRADVGLLPGGRQRPVQAAPAGPDRHPHRGAAGSSTASNGSIREVIPAREIAASTTTSACPTADSTSPTRTRRRSGAGDADILVALAEGSSVPPRIRARPAAARSPFPAVQFSFIASDIVSQILSFGLPAPIDVQIVGAISRRTARSRRETRERAPGHGRSARPPGGEPADASGRGRSHARGPGGHTPSATSRTTCSSR